MKNVTYISAGAGSGKTYSLTHILSDLLKDKKVNPEGVILTTFTEKAASDFKERAKGVLYENGMYSEATRIDQAMIGTIHSVAYSFIKKYWFYLGLSPEMGVLTDEDKEVYINQSLADLPSGEELEQLIGFAEKFNISHPYSQDPKAPRGINEDFWKHHLSDIIGYSTNFSITDYTTSREKSLAFIRQFVKNDITFTTEEIKAVIDEHLAFMLTKGDSDANKKRIKAIREAKRHANNPTIDSLKKLAGTIGSPKGFGPLAAAFKEKYAGIWNSKYIYDQQESYITLIFTLADRWRDNFAEFKRQRNLLDYNDMEKYMLQLIQHPEVQQDIRESYKYLFVDEFQDCSPIQVKIFDQLSELVNHSYWVGDYKQAIYGFRGSDTLLTKAVVDRIEQEAASDSQGEGGCDTRTLEYSYRSQPEIVDVCNKVFTRTFDGILDKSKVELKVPEGKKQTIDRSLRWWMLANEKDEEDSGTTIPFEVYRMIAHEHIEPKDIAVLCRNNYPLDDLMPEFEQYGIPVNRASMPIMETKATQLVLALLSLMVNDRDSLARCQVAYYTQQGYNAEAIIDQRLHNLQHEDCDVHFLEDVDLIRKLLDIRPEIRNQSVGAMVESLIIELGLYDVVKSFGSTQQDHAALDTLIRCAMQYETSCVQINKPATITGYMQWLDAQQPAAEGNTDGVNLMTFHGSKGLEWKHVILMSMDEEPTKRNKMIQHEAYGVHAIHDQTPSADNLFPDVYIRVSPWIFGPSAFGRIQTPADYIEQLYDEKQNPVFARQRLDVLNESNRLLYVGMTRASETLTIAFTEAGMTWAQCVGIQDAGTAEIDNDGNWDMFSTGNSFMYDNTTDAGIIDSLTDTSLQFEDPMDSKAINYSAPRPDNGPRDLSPSQLPHKASDDCEVTLIAQSSERIPLKSNKDTDMAIVGDCIHQIFANIEQNMINNAYFDRIVSDYGLDKVLTDKSAIIGSWAYLLAKLQELYGTEAEKYHERPFKQLLDGHIYTGSIDFTYKTPAGTVLIDFKTCPMGKSEILNPKSNFYAGIYQPQFQCYTHALEAAGENVIAKLVYYPVSGILVELKYEDLSRFNPDSDTFHIFGAEKLDFDKAWQSTHNRFKGSLQVAPIDDNKDDDAKEYAVFSENNSSQGLHMTVMSSGSIHIVLPAFASYADIELAFSFMASVREQFPDAGIYLNNYTDGQFSLAEQNFDYLFRHRIMNVISALENTTSIIGFEGPVRKFFFSRAYIDELLPDAEMQDKVQRVFDEFVHVQWDYKDIEVSSLAEVTTPDGKETFDMRFWVNVDDTLIGHCQKISMQADNSSKIIPIHDFVKAIKDTEYYEKVDAIQFIAKKMPDDFYKKLFESFDVQTFSQSDDEDTTEYNDEKDDEPGYPTPDNIISVNVSLDEFNAVLEGKQSFVDVAVDLSNFRDVLMNIDGNLMLCCDEMPDTFYSCYFWNNGIFPYLVKEELKYIVLVNQTRALYLSIKGNTPSVKNRCLFTKQNTTVLDPDGDACIWNIRFDIQVESYGGIDTDESHEHHAFLLRWNPAISSMTLDRYHNGIEKDWDRGVFDWSVYDWRNAHRGDAFYMLREGDDDCAGIVFRGVFESDPYTDDDWRGSDQQRRYCLYLISEKPSSVNGKPHISMEQLQQNLPGIDWTKGHSGELLTDEQADILSKLWEA